MRRAERSLDTKVEVMERRLDRSIENKDRITFTVLSSVISDYKSLIVLFRSLEVKITDAAILFQMTATKY